MDKEKAVELMQELGVTVEVDSETFEAMLEHPTVKAYINGDVSMSQAIFVEEYLANGFNATDAAKAAKYSAFKRDGFAKIGSSVLNSKKVKALVARRIAERALSANEVIDRIREVADGTIADMLDDNGYVDLARARERQKLHLIKEINIDEDGGAKIKLRDQDKALDSLARSLGVFEKDNVTQLPPEVLALIGLDPAALQARADAYKDMTKWEDEDGEAPTS
jgi:phage terminase small subunit